MHVRTALTIFTLLGAVVLVVFRNVIEDDTRQVPRGNISQLRLVVNPRAFIAENALVDSADPVWIDKDIVVKLDAGERLQTSTLFDEVISGARVYRKYQGGAMLIMQADHGTFQFVIPSAEFERCFDMSKSDDGPITLIFVPPIRSGPCPRIRSTRIHHLIAEAISSDAELSAQSHIFSSKLRDLMKRKNGTH